ncbi:MAG: hypothetical protein ACI8WB_005594 [Phenylobacterium sp.]|jgi:hypothetical protein
MNTLSKPSQLLLLLTLLLGAIFSVKTQAIDIKPENLKGQLAVTVKSIPYPAQLDAELDSGLPNTINVLLWLSDDSNDNGRLVATVDYQVTYDLWDEVYLVNITTHAGGVTRHVVKTKTELLRRLSHITLTQVVDLNTLVSATNTSLSTQVIVNPVDGERIKKIHAWIANSKGFTHEPQDKRQSTSLTNTVANSNRIAPVSGGVGASVTVTRSGGPRFQKLFDKILEQYMQTDEVPALWRSERVSQRLELQQLKLQRGK